MKKVVITDHGFTSIAPERAAVEGAGFTLEEIKPNCTTEDDVIAKCQGADALIVQWAPITRKVLEALPTVKCLVRYGVGVNNLDLEASKDLGVMVVNVPDYCIEEVSDHTVAFALTLCREIVPNHNLMVNGGWGLVTPHHVRQFKDYKYGLVGFGRISRCVAKKVKGFGGEVMAYDPWADEAFFKELGVKRVELNELFSTADIISLHCPLTEETTHLINAKTIATMKPGVILINMARGPVVDEAALIEALQSGKILAAGLDVFETEPPAADNPLRKMPNVVLSSHIASVSDKAVGMLQTKAGEGARDFLLGKRPVSVIVG
jgi:D-3-phosphoglycerate dehydrogenase / 2-oxoglutarate reductase